ncbi:MAG: hypothetical protein KDK08_02820 [Rhizobiaceae bacterium]|nr:hypothetical protein [Rhizobiaceae bacterium]
MTIVAKDSDRFQEVVRATAAQLVSHELIAGGNYITTPLMYASGSYVVVRVERSGADYFVSDFGAGFEEAQLIGGDATYRRVARTIAEANGVDFDNYAFFAILASEGQLAGAIATIANSSQEAVNVTSMKVAEKTHRDDNAILYDRLTSIFTSKMVAKDAHLIGASNTEWHISSLVTIDNRQVAFEAVSKHPNSVVFAATKFGDLARLKRAPGRVAVVTSKKALGTYLGVLSHNANVIERKVGDSVYQRVIEDAA